MSPGRAALHLLRWCFWGVWTGLWLALALSGRWSDLGLLILITLALRLLAGLVLLIWAARQAGATDA